MIATESHRAREGPEPTPEEIADDTHTRRRSARRSESVREGCRQDRIPCHAGTYPGGAFGHIDLDGIKMPQGDRHTALQLLRAGRALHR